MVLGGLLIHLYNFWYNMQFVEIIGEHTNRFGLSSDRRHLAHPRLFSQPVFVIIYLFGCVAIWLHLTHGFWSMFQSIGWANKTWYPRLKTIAILP